MMNERKKLVIIGERGQVSRALQERLALDARYAVSVLTTDYALETDDLSELAAADLVVLAALEFSSPRIECKIPCSVKVLDISPAFRTNTDWVYGLPELPGLRGKIQSAMGVANPGCFATSAILLLEPLVRTGLMTKEASVYLDGVGGFTTGGSSMIGKEAAGELAAESVFSLTREHRHIAEIKQFSGLTGSVWFAPKVAHVPRGIRMQVPLVGVSRESALEAYRVTYEDTAIVVDDSQPSKIPVDEWAHQPGAKLRAYDQPGGCLVVCSMDNLGKGAVDSAMQNIHLML